jgi:hypothetical protein
MRGHPGATDLLARDIHRRFFADEPAAPQRVLDINCIAPSSYRKRSIGRSRSGPATNASSWSPNRRA